MTKPREMRRNDRQITDFDDVVDVLNDCQIGHIGLADDQGPYVVPISFGCEVVGGRVVVWCHGAPEGRKISAIVKDGRVCFEAECLRQFVTDVSSACEMTAVYESVIGFGQARVVSDQAEARHGLGVIVDHYAPGRSADVPVEVPAGVAVLKIELDDITGKRRPHPAA